ncbi:MAG: hypothetical protein GX963_10680 [Bacteroidales bacterium]|nr:hypothetical protein [Bacteroidales bacterium]
MSDKWKKVKLGSLGDIITGKTPKTNDKENYGNDVLFLTPSDNMELRYIKDTIRKLSLKGAEAVQNKILPKESICVSCIGSQLGKVVITTEDTVTNQQINSIIPNDNVDYKYLYYTMLLVGNKLNFLSKTSTAVPIINKTEFSNQEIYLPPLEEQKSIADLLSSFDDKIENNNAIIANLEEQAQTIFKSWFIDFEPFKNKEFVDSEVGLIPKNFSVVKLQEIATRRNGYSYKSKELNELSNTNMITLKNFNRNGGINFNDTKPINDTERMKEFHYLNNGDILIACTDLTQNAEVLGRIISYFKNEDFDKEVYSMDLVKIEPNKIEDKLYVYYYLNSYLFKSFAEGVATGTTVLHLPKKSIDEFKMVYPPSELINKFSHLVKPMLLKQNKLVFENRKLEETRDTLLPKLMSGEIRVEEAIEVEQTL